MEKLKILLISPFATSLFYGGKVNGPGGAERQMALIARNLVNLSYTVFFIGQPIENDLTQDDNRIRIVTNKFRFLGSSKLYLFSDGIRLLKSIIDVKPQVIILRNGGYLVAVWLYIAKFFINTKLILWIQSDRDVDVKRNKQLSVKSKIEYSIYQSLIKRFNLIVAQHKAQADLVKRNFKRKSEVISNFSSNLWFNKDIKVVRKNYILWVGNTNEVKRYELLLEIAKSNPNRQFVVAMNNSNAQKFNEYKKNSEAFGNVRFIGSICPYDMEKYFAEAYLYFNTSSVEGFPNTFLQSFNVGTPVFSLCVNPDAILTNYDLGECLCLTNEINMSYITERINKVYEDKLLWEKYSVNGLNYISRFHSDEKLANKLDDVISLI